MNTRTHRARWLAALACAVFLHGCAQVPPAKPVEPLGLIDISERPAEKALLSGLRSYDDAQYAEAEKHFNEALKVGLASNKDRAAAQKHLAFIYCTSRREAQCEAAFKAARSALPSFTLSKSEAGHPLWGPVYKRLN